MLDHPVRMLAQGAAAIQFANGPQFMEEFSPQIAPTVIAACQTNAAETAAAFSRVFDTPLDLSVGRAATWAPSRMPSGYAGPGLLVQLKISGGVSALVAIPESSGLIPAWYATPDLSGAGKLATLAQELGMLVLPEQFMPEDFAAQRVSSLSAALQRADLPVSAASVDLTLAAADGRQAIATLLWPAKNPAAVYVEPPEVKRAAIAAAAGRAPVEPSHNDFENLPPYGRNLLRINVPVSVTLAAKKQPVNKILELVPGSIIQFEKSCDEMLELEVNEHCVAQGECVKVGDKFGLRITSLVLPPERFSTVRS